MTACFTLLNDKYFTNLIAQIEGVSDPIDLQNLVNEAFADISLLESTITGQIALLNPILSLLTIPATNPAAIVAWITGLINNVLTPMYKPYISQVAQLAALPAEIAAITAAIEAVAALKFPTITISIPTINPNFCTI